VKHQCLTVDQHWRLGLWVPMDAGLECMRRSYILLDALCAAPQADACFTCALRINAARPTVPALSAHSANCGCGMASPPCQTTACTVQQYSCRVLRAINYFSAHDCSPNPIEFLFRLIATWIAAFMQAMCVDARWKCI
jgi:hypothetical protein